MNLILILLLIAIGVGGIAYFLRKEQMMEVPEIYEDKFSLQYLVGQVNETINQVMKTNTAELNLNRFETLKAEKNKTMLRRALHSCVFGDISAKDYVKDYIADLIQKQLDITEETINQVIPFDEPERLSAQDKFEILLYLFKCEYGLRGLGVMFERYELTEPKMMDGIAYVVTATDIERVFRKEFRELSYGDKIKIVSQRIYQMLKGNGVIDEIRDMRIDGVSGGVSGIPDHFYTYNDEKDIDSFKSSASSSDAVWCFYKGKTVHLDFLSFGTEKELIRVCKNIYRYDNPGQLSAAKGYIVNQMKDGSRVVVVRPPFSESWAFFIRKFDSAAFMEVDELITDDGSEKVIETLKWVVKGCQVTGITGAQGTGKTTLLAAIMKWINPAYTLRVQEMAFELNLRKQFPNRNILSFQETDTVRGQDGLDIQKKTDGSVNIIGEVATAPVANWLVQAAQVASKFTMFTHHAKTTRSLVIALRNSLLQEGGFANEKVAEEQVAMVINFDVHTDILVNGHRYIQRVTEILPIEAQPYPEGLDDATMEYYHRTTNPLTFDTNQIITWVEGKYYFSGCFSERAKEEIRFNLTEIERLEFDDFCERCEEEASMFKEMVSAYAE